MLSATNYAQNYAGIIGKALHKSIRNKGIEVCVTKKSFL